MAPEMVEKASSPSSDVYSFGVTLWEMISRVKPFWEYYNVIGEKLKGRPLSYLLGDLIVLTIFERNAARRDARSVEVRSRIQIVAEVFDGLRSESQTPHLIYSRLFD